jgi:hypothetical protein
LYLNDNNARSRLNQSNGFLLSLNAVEDRAAQSLKQDISLAHPIPMRHTMVCDPA